MNQIKKNNYDHLFIKKPNLFLNNNKKFSKDKNDCGITILKDLPSVKYYPNPTSTSKKRKIRNRTSECKIIERATKKRKKNNDLTEIKTEIQNKKMKYLKKSSNSNLGLDIKKEINENEANTKAPIEVVLLKILFNNSFVLNKLSKNCNVCKNEDLYVKLNDKYFHKTYKTNNLFLHYGFSRKKIKNIYKNYFKTSLNYHHKNTSPEFIYSEILKHSTEDNFKIENIEQTKIYDYLDQIVTFFFLSPYHFYYKNDDLYPYDHFLMELVRRRILHKSESLNKNMGKNVSEKKSFFENISTRYLDIIKPDDCYFSTKRIHRDIDKNEFLYNIMSEYNEKIHPEILFNSHNFFHINLSDCTTPHKECDPEEETNNINYIKNELKNKKCSKCHEKDFHFEKKKYPICNVFLNKTFQKIKNDSGYCGNGKNTNPFSFTMESSIIFRISYQDRLLTLLFILKNFQDFIFKELLCLSIGESSQQIKITIYNFNKLYDFMLKNILLNMLNVFENFISEKEKHMLLKISKKNILANLEQFVYDATNELESDNEGISYVESELEILSEYNLEPTYYVSKKDPCCNIYSMYYESI